MQTRLFHSNMTLVTLKIRSSSPDSNYFLRSPNGVFVPVWSKPGNRVARKSEDKAFSKPYMTWWVLVTHIKIRSRSPKSNHFLKLFQWCISASLVKILPLLQKIEHRQCFHSYMILVTLKIRSFLRSSQWCICLSLVKTWPWVQKKGCSQGFYIDIHVHDHDDLEN